MLVIKRSRGQRVVIGGGILVTVIDSGKGWVKLGFDAPRDVPVDREEVAKDRAAERPAADGQDT